MPPSDTTRDLERLETDLKKLETEYNMFFAGRLPRPPWETRSRVEALVKQYDRAFIRNYADRFRFSTLQSRFSTLVNLWDRGLRAREEGRPGPFSHGKPNQEPPARRDSDDRILHVAAFRDPLHETDKLHDLYEAISEARRVAGEGSVPFDRFADLVRDQVNRLKSPSGGEVAFRVAVKDGKVSFTARALKGNED